MPRRKNIELSHAEDLLDLLTPHRWEEHFGDGLWLFRGQASAEWNLLPSAFRRITITHGGTPHETSAVAPWLPAQVLFDPKLEELTKVEQELVIEYATAIDSAGLVLPGDSPTWRNKSNEQSLVGFPPVDSRFLFALAQHHGIPTRLLDWSYSPLVGVYFACENNARRSSAGDTIPDSLALWALSSSAANGAWNSDSSLSFITAPTASNPNLRAQRGVFSCVEYTKEPSEPKNMEYLDLEKWITRSDVQLGPNVDDETQEALVKITLPAAESRVLLRYLRHFDIHGGTLFPGHDGAAKGVREMAYQQNAPKGSRS